MDKKFITVCKLLKNQVGFTKFDLKNNMIVELRNGIRYVVNGEVLFSDNPCAIPLHLVDFQRDLSYIYKGYFTSRWIPDKQKDIVAVYNPVYDTSNLNTKYELLWKRKKTF